MGPSRTKGASIRSRRNAATKVRVRQRPCGALAKSLRPRGAQPRRRVMLVLAQVSSMKTRRTGSSLPWCVFQRARLRATSGRSCSVANRVFFEADARIVHDAPHRAVARHHPAIAQLHHHGPQRQIRNRCKSRQQPISLRRQRPRLPPTHRLRRRAACRPKPPRPLHHARDAHPKQHRRRTARATARHRRRDPLPQIIRIRSRHPMLTSATPNILNQNSTPQAIQAR